jgi:hypothetical protein
VFGGFQAVRAIRRTKVAVRQNISTAAPKAPKKTVQQAIEAHKLGYSPEQFHNARLSKPPARFGVYGPSWFRAYLLL